MSRKRRLDTLGRALAVGLAIATTAAAVDAGAVRPRLAGVRSWAFAIGAGDLSGNLAQRYAAFDLVVVDGQEASRAQVATLRGRVGRLVLGYLDVGTIEPGRPWFARARRYRLEFWPDWGEWFADLSKPGYRRLMQGVAHSMLAKGFDGLFLDNVDMISTHPRQSAGMHLLVGALASIVHRPAAHRRGLLFAQNGEDVIGLMLRYLDGWNREDVTWTYDFGQHRYVHQPAALVQANLDALRRIRRAGLLVTATDYVAAADKTALAEAIRNACSADALPYVSDINLQRIPHSAFHCPAHTPDRRSRWRTTACHPLPCLRATVADHASAPRIERTAA